MTSHELARQLLELPDLPVTFPKGYHASGEMVEEVQNVSECDANKDATADNHFPTQHIHVS